MTRRKRESAAYFLGPSCYQNPQVGHQSEKVPVQVSWSRHATRYRQYGEHMLRRQVDVGHNYCPILRGLKF